MSSYFAPLSQRNAMESYSGCLVLKLHSTSDLTSILIVAFTQMTSEFMWLNSQSMLSIVFVAQWLELSISLITHLITFAIPSETTQFNGYSISLIVTFTLSSESMQLNGYFISLIVTFTLSSESTQLNGYSISLIVTFTLPSESTFLTIKLCTYFSISISH